MARYQARLSWRSGDDTRADGSHGERNYQPVDGVITS